MKLPIYVGIACLLTFVVGTGHRGTYERMLLYNAYIAEEFYKPGEFTIAPGCVGSRPNGRCTFLEMIKHVWEASGTQTTMPGGGDPPSADAEENVKNNWYRENFGAIFVNKKTGVTTTKVGFSPEQDGQGFASRWGEKSHDLAERMIRAHWDQWMNEGKMASGATEYPQVFEKVADAITKARLNLHSLPHEMSTGQTALFQMAEDVGTSIEDLRVEDNEKWRTGGKGAKPAGKGAIADRLKVTEGFVNGLSPEERKNFAVETKSSGIVSKVSDAPWQVFDPVATAARWGSQVNNIDTVIADVNDAYMLEDAPKKHYAQIKAIRETNQKIKNWNIDSIGLCNLA